jgi:NAD-specific glutamate dehydrogenase
VRRIPKLMQERHGDAILQHRLRREIIATKIANASSTVSG